MKKIISLISAVALTATAVFGQAPSCPDVIMPPAVNLCNGGGSTTLNASLIGTNQTTSYTVGSTSYVPYSYTTGTPVLVGTDDEWSSVINIGFNFCYFGATYNQLVIGANGHVTFDLSQAGGIDNYTVSATLPSTTDMPGNTINAVFRDIDPSLGGTMTYQTYGQAPCRAFVVNWSNIPLFNSLFGSCDSYAGSTFQLVLYETTNFIDVNIQYSPSCADWESGYGIVGIQNAAASTAVCPAGRNRTTFTANNESWRFTPSGAASYTFNWYNAAAPGVSLGTSPSLTVSPTTTTTYLGTMVITKCDGTTTTITDGVTVTVNPVITVTPSNQTICGTGTTLQLTVTPTNQVTPANITGGTISYDANGGKIHSFLSSGSFVIPANTNSGNVRVLAVGGGGSGGYITSSGNAAAGGGGGGGVVDNPSVAVAVGSYAVNIGAGGTGNTGSVGNQGGSSTFGGTVTAFGGGGGGGSATLNGATGGSGGGGASKSANGTGGSANTGSSNTATAGGNGASSGVTKGSGGGGGAGGAGPVGTTTATAANGGAGLLNTITGNNVYYGAGGAGANNNARGIGGIGGGGDGGIGTLGINAQPGDPNTGSGGGGIFASAVASGGNGGSGVVIVKYPYNTFNTTVPGTWSSSNSGVASVNSTGLVTANAVGTATISYTFPNGCVGSTTITVQPAVTPTFTALGPYCQNAAGGTLPTTSLNGINGTWSPSTVSTTTAGTTTYTFTPTAGQCANTTTMNITVNPSTTPTFTTLGPYCQNATPGPLPTTSINGISGTWSPSTINTTTVGSTTYTFTPTSTASPTCATTTTMTVVVTTPPTPTFTALGPYCQNAIPGTLPTTSTNGITGTWSPSTISTSTVGSTTYTFTPNGGQCGTTTTMTVVVTTPPTPTFTALGPYCQNAAAGTLPTTSTNGITGTWSPSTVSTTTVGTTTYTFTPNGGQCGTTTTMNITVNAPTTPTFTALGPYCQNAAAGTLPTTSLNGIAGTWSPSTVSTTTVGSTTYTFTPTSTASPTCATTTTMTIVVNAPTTPTFTALGPYCQNATPGTLPTTSLNGIAGTWSPSAVSTATVGSTTYTFTPTSTASPTCATTTTMTVVVNAPTTPTFTALGPYCQNATPGTLPTTSLNGISGTWSPSTINTTTIGSTTYTFTPTSTASPTCATTTTMTVVVNNSVTPTFTALGPYCQNATPGTLPTTSTNGINGTWSPSTVSTATVGSTTYTFTPTAGQCGATTTMTVVVNAPTTPTFNPLGNVCQNAASPTLPGTSTNGISGTWSPSTFSTTTPGTYTSTFTPTAGQCATTTTITLTVDPQTTPTFNSIPPYCVNDAPATLQTTSNNGITGTWSPSTINTSTAGSTNYTFTPNSGQCATPVTITVTVGPPAAPTFNPVGPFCAGDAIPALPTTSTNGVPGTWSPAIDNMNTTTYTFTPNSGVCATTTTLTITINNPVTPNFAAVGPYCSGASIPALPTTSTNGFNGTWSPAINNTTTTTYTFTPNAGQCATTATLTITINAPTTPTFNPLANVCQNATAPTLPGSSLNGFTGTWSPATFSTATAGTFTSTFTPNAGQCATTTTITLTVDPEVTPTFNTIPPYCVNDVPAALQTTSNNGITGTWSPSTINTSTAGSTNYTFTPNGGQCAVPVTITVTVGPPATPTFTAVGPYCSGDAVPALTTTSNNGINGTWSPAIDNTNTTTYTFTPNAGACATTTTLTITINNPTTPNFAAVGPYCSGSTIPALPTTSTNGIDGTWSPAINNTATTTYTFTPNAGECATTTTLTITINAPVTPTFNPLNAVCQNANPPALLTNSTNGIPGTWSPASFSTATAGTYTATFTPNAGQCATTTTLSLTVHALPSISVNSPTTCANSPVQLTANGAVNYTWTPATGLSATTGSPVTATLSSNQTYTIIGTDANGCSSSTQATVTIASGLLIDVTPAAPSICLGESVTLTATGATNYVWSPGATLNTTSGSTVIATPTSTTVYTVNGSDPSGCTGTRNVTVVVNNPTPPVFSASGPYCSGSSIAALPTTSNNGISGTWSPAINNSATTTYTFTPNAGQCAAPGTLTIVINQPAPVTLAPIPAICEGYPAPALPSTDLNGIAGTWSPSTVNNMTSGTYTFTPNTGECALAGSVNSTIVPTPVASFNMSNPTPDISFTEVEFFNASTNADSYSWTFGDGTTSAQTNPGHTYPEQVGSYTVVLTATNAFGCTDETSRVIQVKEDLFIYVPNTFTPDGDAYNNTFFPVISGDFDPQNFTMTLYNRWGETLFVTHDANIGWDGTYHDQLVQEGVYTWKIDLKSKNNDNKRVFNGHVTILK